MQEHCLKQQSEAAQALDTGAATGIDAGAFRIIRGKCTGEWPQDFRMRANCERQQFESYQALSAFAVADGVRNACAQEWADDYRMRRYCETKR
jgi:hypothetical protein